MLISRSVVSLFAALVLGCSLDGHSKLDGEYRATITSILETGRSSFRFNIIDDPRFKEIYLDPIPHADKAYKLILDESAPQNERIVAVLSMQCLPLDDYLRLIPDVATLSSTDENRWVLLYVIGPPLNWSTRLALLFEHSNVRDTLLAVRETPLADESVRGMIDATLSGKIASYLREGQEWQQWECPTDGERGYGR